ncbi:MAG: cobalamin-dependent protein [Deltaproteobacteria bacterium]
MSTDKERKELAAAITLHAPMLAEAATDLQYARQPGVWEPFGERGRALSVRDLRYHLPFLASSIASDAPELFAGYIAWARILFERLGFADEATVVMLGCMRDAIVAGLPGNAGAAVVPFVQAGLTEMQSRPRPVASFVADNGRPMRELARLYLDALLRADRVVATRLVLELVERGADLRDVFLYVLQDVQREVGRLWFTNQISVAKEHYCTAVTQQVIALMYPRIMATPKTGRKIVIACAAGEIHEVGARMVADFFELGGWDAIYLGRDTPASALADAVREHAPDVLGISANMAFNFPAVREGIDAARKADRTGRLKVLAGGYQFNIHPELWRTSGADGCADDARGAVAQAEALAAGAHG